MVANVGATRDYMSYLAIAFGVTYLVEKSYPDEKELGS